MREEIGIGPGQVGHNHGGQVRLPLLGSIFVPSRFGRKYDCGLFHEPPTLLHVSRGLAGQNPLRFRCHPEVTKIVLKVRVEANTSASLARPKLPDFASPG